VVFKSAQNTQDKYRLVYQDYYGKWHPLMFKRHVAYLQGSIVQNYEQGASWTDSFISMHDLPANKSIETFMVPNVPYAQMKKIMLIYDGIIGSNRGIAVCDVEQPIGFTGTLVSR